MFQNTHSALRVLCVPYVYLRFRSYPAYNLRISTYHP
nr:MAG TPA: hypothetical protein [Bacteriophage sp.]